MSSPVETDESAKLKRWQFRKKKKVEKRHEKRQLNAEKNKPAPPLAQTTEPDKIESVLEKQKYERDKASWEEREEKFKLIELAKKTAKEKQEKAKALSQKRWQDTLLNLPMIPPNFTSNKKNTTFKTFVQANDTTPKKKTYRDRFLEKKQANIMK